MKIYELLRVPDVDTTKSVSQGRSNEEVESIDFFTELSTAMYKVENELLDDGNDELSITIVWEFDEWGNLECYKLIDEGMQDGAPDCVTHIYVVRYAGYMIKIIDVIN